MTAGENGVVRVHDVDGGPALAELRGHRGRVQQAAFVPGSNDSRQRRPRRAPPQMVPGRRCDDAGARHHSELQYGRRDRADRWCGRRAAALEAVVGLGHGNARPRSAELPAVLPRRRPHRQRELGRKRPSLGCGKRAVGDRRSPTTCCSLQRSSIPREIESLLAARARRSPFSARTVGIASCSGVTRGSCSTSRSARRGLTWRAGRTMGPSACGTRPPEDSSGSCGDTGSRSPRSRTAPMDGAYVSSGADGTVRVWRVDGGPTAILRGHEGGVSSRRVQPKRAAHRQRRARRDCAGVERRGWRDARCAVQASGARNLGRVQPRRSPRGEHGRGRRRPDLRMRGLWPAQRGPAAGAHPRRARAQLGRAAAAAAERQLSAVNDSNTRWALFSGW